MTATSKIERANQALVLMHSMLAKEMFPTYVELYKFLVGYHEFEEGEGEEKGKVSWDEIEKLRRHFETVKNEVRSQDEKNYFFVNKDYYWTYVEARFGGRQRRLMSLVKLYAPVEYKNLPPVANPDISSIK